MNCNEVKDRLPEFLAGTMSEKEESLFRDHVSSCEGCAREADELSKPIREVGVQRDVSKELKRSLRRVRVSLVLRLTAVLAVLLITVSYVLPGILGLVRFPQMQHARRALALYTQFSMPVTAGGYGNTPERYSNTLRIFTSSQAGLRIVPGPVVSARISYLTGRMTVPHMPLPKFVHPAVTRASADIEDSGRMIMTLQKNLDNRGATISVSLNELISLRAVAALLELYDVKLGWMAVEAGVETLDHPSITHSNNQIYQWGIPGTLTQLQDGSFEGTTLAAHNVELFEQEVIEAMTWLNQNKNLFGAKDQTGAQPIGDKAAYVIDNGIHIYGLQLSGTTEELLRLVQVLDIRRGTVEELSLWWPIG